MPKKIIIICIHSLKIGGMERVASLIANDFVEREDIKVHIILFGIKRDVFYTLSQNITVHKPSFEFNNKYRVIYTIKTLLFLRKKIKSLQPNTILSFGEYWNNLVLVSLLGLKYPVFISDRSQPNKNLGRFQNILRNFLYPKASGYISQTIKASEIASKNKWNNNISIIGNPIKQDPILVLEEKENIILTVGRLIRTKHMDELIDIFKNVNNKNWKLVIVGGNAKNLNLLEEYRDLVHQLGLDAQIELVGAKSNVEDYYKKSKIFAFTSSSEGFPNVLGEAMSFGLPVIAYDCTAGPSDLIQDGETGFLIEERNQKSYEQKLKRLMQESELRNELGTKSLEKIKDFNAESIAEKFFSFIIK